MRQAYDYWQDQPGNCSRVRRAPRPNAGTAPPTTTNERGVHVALARRLAFLRHRPTRHRRRDRDRCADRSRRAGLLPCASRYLVARPRSTRPVEFVTNVSSTELRSFWTNDTPIARHRGVNTTCLLCRRPRLSFRRPFTTGPRLSAWQLRYRHRTVERVRRLSNVPRIAVHTENADKPKSDDISDHRTHRLLPSHITIYTRHTEGYPTLTRSQNGEAKHGPRKISTHRHRRRSQQKSTRARNFPMPHYRLVPLINAPSPSSTTTHRHRPVLQRTVTVLADNAPSPSQPTTHRHRLQQQHTVTVPFYNAPSPSRSTTHRHRPRAGERRD